MQGTRRRRCLLRPRETARNVPRLQNCQCLNSADRRRPECLSVYFCTVTVRFAKINRTCCDHHVGSETGRVTRRSSAGLIPAWPCTTYAQPRSVASPARLWNCSLTCLRVSEQMLTSTSNAMPIGQRGFVPLGVKATYHEVFNLTWTSAELKIRYLV
ncbi:uncharacterized protein LOC110835978 [Zootermopsis nevadensis]|uniref:uncharacterized protein LOC110835978 n=1 Tax=Zootermopsis nevadensis TaxID=136037 RepID=UPI000B8E8C2B|nr:uncharacterized protein LOC110835978 [Zootermopsis nevadensis]